jgi:hypothetical protein
MSSRQLLGGAVILGLVVALVVGVDRCVDRLVPGGPIAATSLSRIDASPATSVGVDDRVKFFDGGYAVGSARDIEAVIAEQAHRGPPTACESPPPTPEERASWKPHKSDLSSVPFTKLLKMSDMDLTVEVSSRLLDKEYGAGYAAMSREEQNVYLANLLTDEVVNGGVDQYFVNSAGNCAERTLVALDEMGLTDESRWFREALALFPDAGPAEDRSTRFDQLEAIGNRRNRWNRLDEHFDSLTVATGSYIRANAMKFSLPP